MKLPIPKDEFEERAISNIERTGLHIMNVFSNEEVEPNFSYSVGLKYSYQQPEILIYGLAFETATDILNNIAGMMKDGKKFKSGDVSLEILDGYECYFVEVDKRHYPEHFGWATWLNDYSDEFDVLQLVWPNKEGLFPHSEDVDEDFKNAQPVLHTQFQ